jgi:hypothetical protein
LRCNRIPKLILCATSTLSCSLSHNAFCTWLCCPNYFATCLIVLIFIFEALYFVNWWYRWLANTWLPTLAVACSVLTIAAKAAPSPDKLRLLRLPRRVRASGKH